jgi:hypothetical protein
VLRGVVSLFRGKPEPLGRFFKVLFHALALIICCAKKELRVSIPLLGGKPEPLGRFLIIPWQTLLPFMVERT